jgi:hypothetical protein
LRVFGSIGAWLPLLPLLLYLAAGFITPWLGHWYFQAFAFGSPIAATIAAITMCERWPIVHPSLSFFYFFPAILLLLHFATTWIQTGEPFAVVDWLPWLLCSFALAGLTIVALVLAFRDHIDREWAVLGTAAIVVIYSAWTLSTCNANLPQAPAAREQATIISINPGMVRSRAWSLTIAPAGPYKIASEHIVSSETFKAADDGVPICLFTYPGAIGWRWTALSRC